MLFNPIYNYNNIHVEQKYMDILRFYTNVLQFAEFPQPLVP